MQTLQGGGRGIAECGEGEATPDACEWQQRRAFSHSPPLSSAEVQSMLGGPHRAWGCDRCDRICRRPRAGGPASYRRKYAGRIGNRRCRGSGRRVVGHAGPLRRGTGAYRVLCPVLGLLQGDLGRLLRVIAAGGDLLGQHLGTRLMGFVSAVGAGQVTRGAVLATPCRFSNVRPLPALRSQCRQHGPRSGVDQERISGLSLGGAPGVSLRRGGASVRVTPQSQHPIACRAPCASRCLP